MTYSTLSRNAVLPVRIIRPHCAVAMAALLAVAGMVGAERALADPPATMAGNSPASRPEQSAAPTTAKAYLDLALQEAAKLSAGNDQMFTYQQIVAAQLVAGDIAAAQRILPGIAGNNERGKLEAQSVRAALEVQIAVALADRGNVADARALNERVEVEGTRRFGEARIAMAEVLDLAKKGKAEEALQKAQHQEEPKDRMTALCGLVREFALAKDAPRARKALDLAIETTSHLDPGDRREASSVIAQAEAIAGDAQSARARVSAIENPRDRDVVYRLVAIAQAQAGDAEGANQTMASVSESGDSRVFGYSGCAMMSLERGDEANARRFLQQAFAAYSADPDKQMRSWTVYAIVGAQTRLGDTAGAMALTRGVNDDRARAAAYQQVACYQTLREGPAAAYTWAQELKSPMERAHAWAGIARGLAERQKRAGTQAGQ